MAQPVPDAPTLCWSVGRSKTTARWSPSYHQSWSQFVAWLQPEKPASKKEVLPYVGASLQDGRRTIGTVEERFFLTLDADYADEFFPSDVALEFMDTPYVIHTTWRHTAEAPRYRLIIPLSRGVKPSEYKALAWTVMNRLDGKRFDVTTAQAERFMWGPSCRTRKEYFSVSANPRAPYLPVDVWLDGHHGPSEAPAATGQGNPPPATRASRSEAHTASDEDKERALEILLQACDQVEHVYEREDFEGRNEAVFHLLPLLLRFCAAGALEEDTVLEALWDAASLVSADEPYERSEFNASVRKAREYAAESGPALPDTTATKMAQADFADIDVEDAGEAVADIWGMTDALKHIKQAGDFLGRNPLALLSMVIARVLAEAPAGTCLPGASDGAIGSRAALNLGVALVGTSGQGKSTFRENSGELLGLTEAQRKIEGSPSTGQGLIQAYLKTGEKGENVLIDDPRRLFIVDEIDTLGALSKDTGSTLLSEVRTMLTGGATGSSNATKDRQRQLHARTYNFQLVIGVQPARAGVLLEGRDAGTPQRFIWVQVTAPKDLLHPDDRPEWPGVLDWNTDFMWALDFDPVVKYPGWLLDELREYDYKIGKEGILGGELSKHGHHNLLRLKVAAGIAFLHQSVVIEDMHIEIADMILSASRITQNECEKAVRNTEYLRKKSRVRDDEMIKKEVSEEKLERLVKNARGVLLRAGGWTTWQNIRPAHRDREEYEEAVWEALVAMEDVDHEEIEHGQRVRRKMRIVDE